MPNIIINLELSKFNINSLNNRHKNIILIYFYVKDNDNLRTNVINNVISNMKCHCTIVKIKITETVSCHLDQLTMIYYNGKHRNNIISNRYGNYLYDDKKITINKFNSNNVKDLLQKVSRHHIKNTIKNDFKINMEL
jgi:hypothetical protein